jgi:uncharacterized protein YdhG (YjbR/CyaY superfamily)
MKKPKSVDEYIASAPKEARSKLRQMRKIIREMAPQAEEKISYGMPYYSYKGRLAYFAAIKNHISLFLPTPTVEEHKSELKNYVTTKATVHFLLDKKIPIQLIKKLVRARMKRNGNS